LRSMYVYLSEESMRIHRLGNNETEVVLKDGTVLFISYDTPVAMYCPIKIMHFRTDTKWSVTTSKHINKWLNGVKSRPIKQQELTDIFNSI
jgi:hypothetical protein